MSQDTRTRETTSQARVSVVGVWVQGRGPCLAEERVVTILARSRGRYHVNPVLSEKIWRREEYGRR